jgi:glycosyltransferase involved in cell wall biosynthesis
MSVRLAHVFSSDLAIPASLPYLTEVLRRGWDVTMITPDGPHARAAATHGLRWLPLDLTRRLDFVGDARGSARLLRQLVRGRYDIVHTHNAKVGLVARVLATVARAPIVVHTLHGLVWSLETPEPKRTIHASLERLASLRTHAILAQSREDRDALVAMRVAPRERMVRIGNGIDLSRFDPDRVDLDDRRARRTALGLTDDDVLFVSAGRLVREKGFVELFEALELARRRDPRIHLAVAGRADAEKDDALSPTSLREASARGGLHLLGETREMPAIYAASDVVCLASWREGMPRALMEGSAMGKPLLASDARGCREVVVDGRTGRLFPTRDAHAIADAMVELARDPARRAALGEAGRAYARSEFDVARAAARVVAVYDALLEGRGLDALASDPIDLGRAP